MESNNYLINSLNKWMNKSDDNTKKKNTKVSIALIGLGPHSKRIYLNYFKKHKINLALLVDLESKKDYVRNYLNDNGFKNTKIFTIQDSMKDNEYLDEEVSSCLQLLYRQEMHNLRLSHKYHHLQ